MLTVHHLDNSRSQRVLWLLEELDVAYELVRYPRDPATLLAPSKLREVHPLGKSPVITDGDETVAESGAILEYLVEKYGAGRFMPGPETRLRCRYFMHYAEGSLMPILLVKLVAGRVRAAKVPFFARPITRKIAKGIDGGFVDPNLGRHLAFLDGALATSPWFAGEQPTIADVQMSYPMEAIAARMADVPARIADWVKRVQARPAYQRAAARGGPSQLEL